MGNGFRVILESSIEAGHVRVAAAVEGWVQVFFALDIPAAKVFVICSAAREAYIEKEVGSPILVPPLVSEKIGRDNAVRSGVNKGSVYIFHHTFESGRTCMPSSLSRSR